MGSITDVSELGIDSGLKYNTTTKVLSAPTGYLALGQASAVGARVDVRIPLATTLAANRYRMESMAHGMTDILPTDCFGQVDVSLHASGFSEGGLQIIAIGAAGSCATSVNALTIQAYHGVTDPTDVDAAIKIVTGKKSGTNATTLAAAETALELLNYTTSLLTVVGSGNAGLGIIPVTKLHLYQPTAYAACKTRTQINSLGGYWDVGSVYASSAHQYQFVHNPGSGDVVKMAIDANGVAIGSYAGSSIAPSGGLIVSGGVAIGDSSASGKLHIFVPKAATPNSIVLSQQDLAHGITTLLPTGSFGGISSGSPSGYSEGGLLIRGISTNPDVSYVSGVWIEGITETGEGTPTCIVFNGAHKDGTGVTAVGVNGLILSIANNDADKIQVFGDGTLKILSPGALMVDHIYNATSLHPITFDYDVTVSTKLGVGVVAATAPFAVAGLASSSSCLAAGDFYYYAGDGRNYVCVV